ncbi:MAG TPA: amidohydrolase [Bacteroidia bacterium]|nr:amidohydrolase [Bacteroidia bacterium]HNS12302.1 amidohydrolase [Bacteroidia bacterium]
MSGIDYDLLKRFRREIHAFPEISGGEKETARKVLGFLKNCSPDEIITDIGGYGIVATWDSGVEGPEIIFRAELDALPIEEINTFDYKSAINGVSHKCGHDGHSTILCGLAKYLSVNKNSKGKVRLIFQPAEENGEGAKAMLEDEKFKGVEPDFIFALHNLPGYPMSKVVVKDNTFTAAVNSIIIHLTGKTSHAAEPEHGLNPALAVAEIIQGSMALANNYPDKEDMRVITPVYMDLGTKDYGISAGVATVHLTIRCWNDEYLRKLEEDIIKLSEQISKKHKLSVKFDFTQTFHANINNSLAAEKVRKAAKKLDLSLDERQFPFKWGEDFGLFTSRFKGCMFGLGAGENMPALHNPDYDFPDELIETGVKIFIGIMHEVLLNN